MTTARARSARASDEAQSDAASHDEPTKFSSYIPSNRTSVGSGIDERGVVAVAACSDAFDARTPEGGGGADGEGAAITGTTGGGGMLGAGGGSVGSDEGRAGGGSVFAIANASAITAGGAGIVAAVGEVGVGDASVAGDEAGGGASIAVDRIAGGGALRGSGGGGVARFGEARKSPSVRSRVGIRSWETSSTGAGGTGAARSADGSGGAFARSAETGAGVLERGEGRGIEGRALTDMARSRSKARSGSPSPRGTAIPTRERAIEAALSWRSPPPLLARRSRSAARRRRRGRVRRVPWIERSQPAAFRKQALLQRSGIAERIWSTWSALVSRRSDRGKTK